MKETMLKKKTWAVVGATDDTSKYGYKIYKKLKQNDYTVYPINPNCESIEEDKVYNNLSELPTKPDVVNFVVNPKIGIKVLKECIQLGITNIWLQPGTVDSNIKTNAGENNINVVEDCVLISL